MRSVDELQYPVVVITPNYILGSIENAKQLTTVGQINLERGCFDGAVIVDSAGNRYVINGARMVRPTFNPWNVFKKYRTVIVELGLSNPQQMSLDQLRADVVELILKHPKWHRHYGETASDIERKFSHQNSIAELIRAISIYP